MTIVVYPELSFEFTQLCLIELTNRINLMPRSDLFQGKAILVSKPFRSGLFRLAALNKSFFFIIHIGIHTVRVSIFHIGQPRTIMT